MTLLPPSVTDAAAAEIMTSGGPSLSRMVTVLNELSLNVQHSWVGAVQPVQRAVTMTQPSGSSVASSAVATVSTAVPVVGIVTVRLPVAMP